MNPEPDAISSPDDLRTSRPNPFKRAARPPSAAQEASFGRLPPHAPDAERGLLACALADPTTIEWTVRHVGRDGTVFYDLRHRAIWETIMRLIERNGTVDSLTLCEELRATGQLDAVGGMTYVQVLSDASPSPANHPYYLEILMERAGARAALASMTEAIGRIYEQASPWPELADHIESQVGQACRTFRKSGGAERTVADQVGEAITMMEQIEKGPAGFLTGYPDLDKLTMGLRAKQLIILAGRPGTGKSALMLNIARHNIWQDDEPVGFFSLEMSAAELINRIAGSWAGVDLQNPVGWCERDYSMFQGALGRLTSCRLHIDDDSSHDILSIRAKARAMKRRFGIRCLMVDYLQLVSGPGKSREHDRNVVVGEVARGLKQLAGELDIPIIAGCSMNRMLDRDGPGSRPKLMHLRESGDIEAHADKVMTLYRMAKNQEEIDREDRTCFAATGLDMLKQRGGRLDTVHLMFNRKHVKFESCSRVMD